MVKKILFTVLSATVLGGGCLLYIRYILKDKDKCTDRVMKLFDDKEDAGDDSNN